MPALGGWVVTRYDLATEVLRDADRFTVDHPGFTTAQVVGPSMLSLDGVAHHRHRTPFLPFHRAAALRGELEAWIAAEARRLVGALVPGRDLRTALAGPLAAASVSRFLGLVAVDVAEILGWYRSIVEAVNALTEGRAAPIEGALAMDALADSVRQTIEADPASMAAIVARESSLTKQEIVSNVAVIMFGAIETAEGMITNTFWHLLSRPDVARTVAGNHDLVPAAIEESLRLEPAATRVDRYCTTDAVLDGATIGAGDLVVVSLAAANRDPAIFPHPDEFRIDRPNGRQHLAFAVGPHTCIGQPMARFETATAVSTLLAERPAVTLDLDASRPPTGLVFRKPPAIVISS